MAIDNAEKRKSIIGIFYVAGPGVTPNALKDAEWRQESGYSYAGISAGTPSLVTYAGNVSMVVTLDDYGILVTATGYTVTASVDDYVITVEQEIL